MRWYENFALLVVAFGALNWGFTIFGLNLIYLFFGTWSSFMELVIYFFITLCGGYSVYIIYKINKRYIHHHKFPGEHLMHKPQEVYRPGK